MKFSCKLWEDKEEEGKSDLVIGLATHKEFSSNDFKKYGNTISLWTELLDASIEKQKKLTEEYEKNIGPLEFLEPIEYMEISSGQLQSQIMNESIGNFKQSKGRS